MTDVDALVPSMKKLTAADCASVDEECAIQPWMVVQTATFKPDPRLPPEIQKRVVSEHEKRQEIARLWKEGGRVKTFIPGSKELRDLQVRHRILMKQIAKDKEVLDAAGRRGVRRLDQDPEAKDIPIIKSLPLED